MNRVLRFVHVIGMTLFLGSIVTFIVVSSRAQGGSVEDLAFARTIISAGTDVLTVPGLWISIVSGIVLGLQTSGLRSILVPLKAGLGALLVLNASLFIVPAATRATELAVSARALGAVPEAYGAAYLQESVFGGINVILALVATTIGIWRIGAGHSTQ